MLRNLDPTEGVPLPIWPKSDEWTSRTAGTISHSLRLRRYGSRVRVGVRVGVRVRLRVGVRGRHRLGLALISGL